MHCKSCNRPFNDKERTPRILIGCGHTLCEECILKYLDTLKIRCFDCGVVSEVKQPSDFPKNLILMGIKSDSKKKMEEVQGTCNSHLKPLEAFCEKEKVLLCIDCILMNGHKTHEISPILQSSEMEKERMKKCNEECLKLDDDLKILTNSLESYRTAINEKANKFRESITVLFGEIQNAVHERESQLQQDVASVLEKEEDVINGKLNLIEQHRIASELFKAEMVKLDCEDSISILQNVIEREDISKNATRPLPTLPQNALFPEINKDKEIANITKMLSPSAKVSKPNLHSDTANSLRRKVEAIPKSNNIPTIPSKKVYSKYNSKRSNDNSIHNKVNSNNCLIPFNEHAKFSKMISPKKEKKRPKIGTSEFLICTSPQPLRSNDDATISAALNLESSNNSFSRIEENKMNSKNSSQDAIFKEFSILNDNNGRVANKINDPINLLKERRDQLKELKNKDVDADKKFKQGGSEIVTTIDTELKKMNINDKVKSILDKVDKLEKEENKFKQDQEFKMLSKKEITSPSKPSGDTNPPESRKDSLVPISEQSSMYKSKLSITPSMYDQIINSDINADYQNLFSSLLQYIFVFSGMQKSGLISCERFDIQKGIWKECKQMNKARSKFAAVSTIDSKVYILGGKLINAYRTDEIEIYDPLKDEWSLCPLKLHKGKSSFAAISDGVGIYVCGGSDGSVLSSFHYLDINAKEWKGLPDMATKREELGLAIGPDKKIYAIGGYNGKECLKSGERYNIETKKWEPIAPMNIARRSLCAVALPDGIYVMGGYDGAHYLNSCEKYDEKANKWVVVKPMKNARCTMSAVSSTDCRYIYVLGGYFDSEPLRFVERYDAMCDKWEIITPMKNKRFMHSAVIMMLPSLEEIACKNI